MKEKDILEIFEGAGGLLKGHFKLSSGLHSGQYLQCALVLQNAKPAERLCKELASKFTDDNITAVIGPALGGVVVSHEVARALGVKALFSEREDGIMTLKRGFSIDKNDRILVVEDVVTTGRSTKEVIEMVKKSGAALAGVGSLVCRGKNIDFGGKFLSLLKIDIPTFKPADCLLCKENIPVIKPGSRRGE